VRLKKYIIISSNTEKDNFDRDKNPKCQVKTYIYHDKR